MEDVIVDLQKKYNVIFRIISDQNPYFKNVKYEYSPWNKENEINDLLNFDIGLMPLSDDEWSKGDRVIRYNLDGEYFIRTDGNKKKSDNLGKLPKF